jgi:hypothetical protein
LRASASCWRAFLPRKRPDETISLARALTL